MAEVLIIDDDIEGSQALAKFIERAGHTVRHAENGRRAIAQVLDPLPDVLVLDLYMPQMDEPSFLEVIRSYLRFTELRS